MSIGSVGSSRSGSSLAEACFITNKTGQAGITRISGVCCDGHIGQTWPGLPLTHLSSSKLFTMIRRPLFKNNSRKSTGATASKSVVPLRVPPIEAHPISVLNKLYAGIVGNNAYEWYGFDIVDPVYWHVIRDPPPADLNEHVTWKSGDILTTDPTVGNPLLIPADRWGHSGFAARKLY